MSTLNRRLSLHGKKIFDFKKKKERKQREAGPGGVSTESQALGRLRQGDGKLKGYLEHSEVKVTLGNFVRLVS